MGKPYSQDLRERVLFTVDGGTLAASGWYSRADHKGWTNMPNEA